MATRFAGVPLGGALPLPHVDNEEGGIEAAFAHLRKVVLEAAADPRVHRIGLPRRCCGNVDVRVDGDDAGVDLPGLGQDFLVGHFG
jgi:hypothetical protein